MNRKQDREHFEWEPGDLQPEPQGPQEDAQASEPDTGEEQQ